MKEKREVSNYSTQQVISERKIKGKDRLNK